MLHKEERRTGIRYSISLSKKERSHFKKKHVINLLQTTNHFLNIEKATEFLQSPASSKEYHINLKNVLNTQYIGQLSIGDPLNVFEMIFDTGSPNIWVNSVHCDQDECRQRKQYDS